MVMDALISYDNSKCINIYHVLTALDCNTYHDAEGVFCGISGKLRKEYVCGSPKLIQIFCFWLDTCMVENDKLS